MIELDLKYFTPKEAKNTLPLVKKIVSDILITGFLLKSLTDALNGNIAQNDEIKALVNKLSDYLAELEEIGCFYKDWDFSVGMVDFPSRIDGRDVYLCWRGDEEDILFYHTIEDGYHGRKPIPQEYFV